MAGRAITLPPEHRVTVTMSARDWAALLVSGGVTDLPHGITIEQHNARQKGWMKVRDALQAETTRFARELRAAEEAAADGEHALPPITDE